MTRSILADLAHRRAGGRAITERILSRCTDAELEALRGFAVARDGGHLSPDEAQRQAQPILAAAAARPMEWEPSRAR